MNVAIPILLFFLGGLLGAMFMKSRFKDAGEMRWNGTNFEMSFKITPSELIAQHGRYILIKINIPTDDIPKDIAKDSETM